MNQTLELLHMLESALAAKAEQSSAISLYVIANILLTLSADIERSNELREETNQLIKEDLQLKIKLNALLSQFAECISPAFYGGSKEWPAAIRTRSDNL